MAVIDPNDKKNNEANQLNPQGSPLMTGGGTSGFSPAASPMGAEPKRQGSGRFVNLNKYMEVNKGAGQQLGNRIQNTLESDIGKQQHNAGNVFQQGQGYIQQGQQGITQGRDLLGKLRDPGQSAQSLVGNASQVSDFRNQKAFDEANAQNFNQQAMQAQQQAFQNAQKGISNIGSEEGRFGLLDQFAGQGVAKRKYNLGQKRLDQLLLEADKNDVVGNVQKTLTDRQRAIQSLGQDISYQGDLVNQLRADENKLASQFGGALDKRVSGFQQTAQKAEADARSYRAKSQDLIERALRGEAVDPNELQKALPRGMLQDYGDIGTYDMDAKQLGGLFTGSEINQSNVLNAGQKAERDAIAQLAGLQNANDIIAIDDKQLGSYSGPLKFNADRFKEASSGRGKAITEELKPITDYDRDVMGKIARQSNSVTDAENVLKNIEDINKRLKAASPGGSIADGLQLNQENNKVAAEINRIAQAFGINPTKSTNMGNLTKSPNEIIEDIKKELGTRRTYLDDLNKKQNEFKSDIGSKELKEKNVSLIKGSDNNLKSTRTLNDFLGLKKK